MAAANVDESQTLTPEKYESKRRKKKTTTKGKQIGIGADTEVEDGVADPPTAVGEDERWRTLIPTAGKGGSQKRKRKAKKDKWGQPLAAEAEAAEEEFAVFPPPEADDDDGGVAEAEPEAAGGYEAKKVVASGLPYTTTEADIRAKFEHFGAVTAMQLSRFPDSGHFRGLVFVSFETEAAAVESLKLDGSKMGGRFIKVERCRVSSQKSEVFGNDPEKTDGCLSAYVGNLALTVTEADIRSCFRASKIAVIRFTVDRKSGSSRRFCHVDFEDEASLEKAMEKNRFELHGRRIKVAYAISKN